MKRVLQLNLKRTNPFHVYVWSKLVVKDSVKMLKNDLITNKVDIAKVLNDHFHLIFAKESVSIPPSFAKEPK